MTPARRAVIDNARTVWPEPRPRQIEIVLRAMEAGLGLRSVAGKCGISPSALSEILARKYRHRPKKIFRLIEQNLTEDNVHCRALSGSIPRQSCLENQENVLNDPSSMPAIRFGHICRACPHWRGR